MRVLMEVHRRGEQYLGSLTRVSDEVRVPFSGVLELMAALERLEPEEPGRDEQATAQSNEMRVDRAANAGDRSRS